MALQPLPQHLGLLDPAQLPVGLLLVLQRQDGNPHVLDFHKAPVAIQVSRLVPRPAGVRLLNVAHQLDFNAVDEQRSEMRTESVL